MNTKEKIFLTFSSKMPEKSIQIDNIFLKTSVLRATVCVKRIGVIKFRNNCLCVPSLSYCRCYKYDCNFCNNDYVILPTAYHRILVKITAWGNEGPMLETLDHTICIGSTPTFLYFDLYLYSAYAAHYVYSII